MKEYRLVEEKDEAEWMRNVKDTIVEGKNCRVRLKLMMKYIVQNAQHILY